MRNSKKNLFNSLFFIMLLLFLLSTLTLVINIGVRNSNYAQTFKVNLVMDHENDPEIVVFGSSVSEVGVDPRIISAKTKMTCYNYSINGTRFSQYKCLLNEFNQSSFKNSVVILSETYFSFEPVDRIASIEYYLAHITNKNIYNALFVLDSELIWKSRFVPFYQYIPANHIYYKNALIGWGNIFRGVEPVDSCQGFSPVYKGWESDADDALKVTRKFEVVIDQNIVKEYEDNLELMRKNGKRVFIVLTPMFISKLKLVTNLNPLINTLKTIALHTNSVFIDFSKTKLCDEKANFYNSSHLNFRGSQLFSKQLGDSLNYYLLD